MLKLHNSFFHKKTIQRRRVNKVVTIQDDARSWLQDEDEIRTYAVSFFANLYSKEEREYRVYPASNDFPRMTSDMLSTIMQPVNDEEIMRTVFSMHPTKAPGVDGLHAIFYQSQWQVVGPSVCKVVKEVFGGKNIPWELNKTLIVLIPKTNNPTNLKMFRPISLCRVVYKIITKIVTNRLKEVLPYLMGPTQTSFIPGRLITENIVIAQEVVHSMRKKKGKVGQMAIKVGVLLFISGQTPKIIETTSFLFFFRFCSS